jgi:predicted DsbA family dithiol-disulfide isomerase
MAGLVADVGAYRDPINDIHNPAQIGPQWLDVANQTGAPLNPALWEGEPPRSSYPACVAAKAAEQLGEPFAERYLRRLREAAMLEARDVSQTEVLLDLADEVGEQHPDAAPADREQFAAALAGPEARRAFRDDLTEVRYRQIGRFPSLLIHRDGGNRGLLLTGYRPYDRLLGALFKVAPDLQPLRRGRDLPGYVNYWGRVTQAEIAALFDTTPEDARARLAVHGLQSALAEVPSPTA